MTHEELMNQSKEDLVLMVENLQNQLSEKNKLSDQYYKWWSDDRKSLKELEAKMDTISAMNKLGMITLEI